MIFFTLFIVPALLVAFFYFFLHKKITLTELALLVVAAAVVAGCSVAFIYHQNVSDDQVLNGRVTSKYRQTVPCDHTYSCDCHQVPYDCSTTDSKGKRDSRTCYRTECDTCYEHSGWSRKSPGDDYDWVVESSLNHNFRIARVNRRGDEQPQRWTLVKTNDPVAVTVSYDNYIKAAPGTLFQRQGLVERYKRELFSYPIGVYDYYHLDRVAGNFKPHGYRDLVGAVALMNSRLQRAKANVVLVLLKGKSQDFAYALEQHWIGGKKNDAVVLINTDDGNKITWTYVMSWTKQELFKVELRNHVNEIGVLDFGRILPVIENDVNTMFEHRSMKDFEYLKAAVVPTTAQLTWSMIINLVVCIGLTFLFAHPDVDISVKNMNGTRYRRF